MLPAVASVEQVLLGPHGLLSGAGARLGVDRHVHHRPGRRRPGAARWNPDIAGRKTREKPPPPGSPGQRQCRRQGRHAADLRRRRGGPSRRARPLLEAMGDPERILYVGAHGSGYTVKLMLNLLWFAHLVRHGRGAHHRHPGPGWDLATLRHCLLASPAASRFPRPRRPVRARARRLRRVGSRWRWRAKTSAWRWTSRGAVGVPVELSALVEQVYRRARAQYGDPGGEKLPSSSTKTSPAPPSACPAPHIPLGIPSAGPLHAPWAPPSACPAPRPPGHPAPPVSACSPAGSPPSPAPSHDR